MGNRELHPEGNPGRGRGTIAILGGLVKEHQESHLKPIGIVKYINMKDKH